MKKIILVLSLVLTPLMFCGEAASQKVRLRSQITPVCGTPTSTQKFSDIYADGNIAVMGSFSCRGAFIFDISNPDAPVLAAHYNPGNNIQFLEAIVVGNRGYFGSGGSGGVHIVDLTNPASPTLLGNVNPANGNGHSSIHEMMVYQQNGATYLIENSNNTGNKIIKIINVTNPATAVFVRDLSPGEISWVHAMHIRGNRMITSGWGNFSTAAKIEIWDITNLAAQAPTLLGTIQDPGGPSTGNNNHSTWTSEDGSHLYSAREISGAAANGPNAGDVRVYDISNPSSPLLINRLTMLGLGLNAVTPHNPVVMGNKLYISWYQAGLQLFDITIQNDPRRIGQYDTFQPAFSPEQVEVDTGGDPWDVFCGRNSLAEAVPTGYDGAWAVFPFLGEDKVLIGDLAKGLFIVDVSGASAPAENVVSDFDGDRKTDLSTYSPATGLWTVEQSSNSTTTTLAWGVASDVIVPGDYDGDGKSDHAIWRPSTGTWWFVLSSNGSRPAVQFGSNGDIPVPGDYDADGKTDVAVWRPSNGAWYIQQSTLGLRISSWGISGDRPITGDFEGDGKADIAVWRPSNGTWYVLRSSSSIPIYATFGSNGDKPLSGDFNGDGMSDFSVYRPSTGVWYVLNSGPVSSFSAVRFGLDEDIPVSADYDGDSKADIAVFRPSTNVWYRLDSSNGAFFARVYGQNGDRPSPSSVNPQ